VSNLAFKVFQGKNGFDFYFLRDHTSIRVETFRKVEESRWNVFDMVAFKSSEQRWYCYCKEYTSKTKFTWKLVAKLPTSSIKKMTISGLNRQEESDFNREYWDE